MPPADRLCTALELADALGISKQRVYVLTRLEGFPAPAGWQDSGRLWSLAAVRQWRLDRERAVAGAPK